MTTCWPSTARNWPAAIILTGCSATRPIGPCRLTVNSKPNADGARTVTFQPISSETDLRYLAYVTRNRDRVTRLSGGRVGYIHIPNMGAEGIREFIKWFYPQVRKEGLVVDVRYNGGGNVSQMLIERLRRELLATGFARTSDTASTYPGTVFHGHLVCVLNQNSASDGDIFPAMFKQARLGPLDRQAIVGRRGRHHQSRPAGRRRTWSMSPSSASPPPTAAGSSRVTASIPTSKSRTTRSR